MKVVCIPLSGSANRRGNLVSSTLKRSQKTWKNVMLLYYLLGNSRIFILCLLKSGHSVYTNHKIYELLVVLNIKCIQLGEVFLLFLTLSIPQASHTPEKCYLPVEYDIQKNKNRDDQNYRKLAL